MQGCIPLIILFINAAAPRLQVINSGVTSRVAGPMQRSRLLIIRRVYADAFCLEVAKGVGLIALRSYMEHIEATLRLDKRVRSVLNQQIDQLRVTVTSCIV